jgi:hypothetical protein
MEKIPSQGKEAWTSLRLAITSLTATSFALALSKDKENNFFSTYHLTITSEKVSANFLPVYRPSTWKKPTILF